MTQKTLGQIGYTRYGETPGNHGTWTTHDGRTMPKWEELSGEVGELTKARWEEAGLAMMSAYEARRSAPVQGGAISPNPVGA